MKKMLLIVLTIMASIFVIGALTSCTEDYKYWTNVIENYDEFDVLDIFLSVGETQTIDIYEQFKDSKIEISKVVSRSSNEGVFTIKNHLITATGMGKAKLDVEIYSKKESTCYYATSAIVYVVDPNYESIVEIKTAQDLAQMKLNQSGYYILKSDIDLKDWEDWAPIGNLPITLEEPPYSNAFCGMLINPDGYKIRNLTIKSLNSITQGIYGGYYGGLFGSLYEAYIDGIILENVFIDLTDFDGRGSSAAGGIAAAQLNSVIRNCKVDGTIIAQDRSGGIVGGASWGRILDCSFSGTVQSTEHAAGGIAGFGYITKNCTVNATINGTFASGGILGFQTSNYQILDCSFTGELLGNGYKNESIGYTYS
ncbi:MAG: hypothetical protein K2N64_02695 [Anaeroplasmataceae bacterium]|nr:hypothetical protein [Anaeroplasmataceae bacterium]